ncbi:hypothetical protein QTP70_015459, partial [Hemibagrus guttatus]
SKSQNALWNTITSGLGVKDKVKSQRSIADDPRSPEEILAEEFPSVDSPDATEKAAIRGDAGSPLVLDLIHTSSSSLSLRINFTMESPTKEIEEFESTSLKYLQPDQIEKIWLRLRGLRKYKKTSQRLRCLVKQLERGEASLIDLKKNLEYAASVLESVYIEETSSVCDVVKKYGFITLHPKSIDTNKAATNKQQLIKQKQGRLVDTEDELSDIQSDSVPSEVRDWLASTFTRQMGLMLRRTEEKPRFRSIVHAVQAGIFVERMYRRTSNMVGLSYPASVITVLKHIDKWTFDVFALNESSGDHALKFIFYELLTRYDLISRFKIPISALVSFVEALEVGYSKHKNPYHNLIHAADVTQTVHYLMLKTGMVHWMTELEIFALIFAAAVHDYEHTGTTNNFHIQTRSDTAILYNDRSVLESHHVSAAYRLLQDDDEMNILYNLSKDDWSNQRGEKSYHYSTPLHSTPLYSTPLHSTILHSTPLHSTPLHSTLLYSTPLHSTPLYSTPLHSTPLYSTPLHSTPLYSTLLYYTPLHSTPLHSTPLHSTPLHSTPLHSTLLYYTPLHSTPLHSTPLYSTLLHSALLYSTPLHSTPLHSTPFHSTPLHSTPLYSTPTYSTPLYYTPLYYTPLYSTPLHSTLLHSTPLHSTPLHSTPLYSTLLYYTPLHSTPLYSTPLHSTLLHSTLLQPTPLHSTILHSTILHSTPLYSTPLHSTPLHSTPTYSTPLYSTPLHSTLLHSTLLQPTPLHSTILHSTILHSTPLYSTPLHSTPLHSTLLHSTLLHSTLLHSTLLYSTLLYSTLLHSTPLYSTLLHSTPLHSTPLHSTLLYSTPLHSTPLYSTPLHSTPLHSTPLCSTILSTLLYSTPLHSTPLYSTLLYYTLYSTLLHSTLLYYTILNPPVENHCSTQLYYNLLYYTLLHSTILYCTPLYSTILYTTLLYSTLLYYTLLHSTVLYSTPLYCNLLYSTILYSTLLYSTPLYSTILYYTLLYSTILYSTLLHSTPLCSTILSTLLYSTLLHSTPLCSTILSTLLHPTPLYSTPLYSTLLYSTPLHSTPLHSTLLYSTLLYSTLLYSTLLYSTPLHSTPLHSTLLYSTLLYSTLLYSTPLYSTLLYYTLYSTLLHSTLLYYTILNPPVENHCSTQLYYNLLYYTLLHSTILYCTPLYSTILYSTLLYSTLLYYTVLHSTVLYSTPLYCNLLYSTPLYSTLLHSTLLYCTLLYFTLLYSTLLYYTLLYSIPLYSTLLIDKPKALSLVLHTADISHPAKNWDLHHHWTSSLLEEFFRQDSEFHTGSVEAWVNNDSAIGAVDLQGAGGNWATVGRRSRGGRRVRRQREKRKRVCEECCGGCELEEKERFWSELDEVMESIPTGERVGIGADFNGHVGEGNTGDEEVMGKFGVKERNLQGQMVVLPDDWETTAEVIRETGRKVLGVSSGRRKEDKETWWWNEEVQDSIQRKRLAKKKWDMDRTEENRQEYKELQRRVKREVSKAKQKAYDELYTRKSTTDAIFALRIFMEKYRDGQRELHCVFVDLEKAYDRVPREELWYCMRKSEVAKKYVRVVQDMYEREIERQGQCLSVVQDMYVMDQLSEEVREESPWTMMFADDIVICSESREQVEENLERWRFALERRGMKGDKEAELGLPFSPLCDRKSTMVAQSQIGFIDFIVVPTFTVLTDMTEKIVTPLIDEATLSSLGGFRRSSLSSISTAEVKQVNSPASESSASHNCSLLAVDLKNFKAIWNEQVLQNRERWKARAAKETEEKAKREAEERAQLEAGQEGQTEAGTDQSVPKSEGSGQEPEPEGTTGGPNETGNAESMEGNKQLPNGT